VRGRPDALALLHSIILDPDNLEPGLRLLAMDHEKLPGACLAWGLDHLDRCVVLYVTPGIVHRTHLNEAVSLLASRFPRPTFWTAGERPPVSGEGSAGPPARLLVIAAGFGSELLSGPPALAGWTLELLQWSGEAEGVGFHGGFHWGNEASLPYLTSEEVESVLGAWPAGLEGRP
jgi:hypothetical protein